MSASSPVVDHLDVATLVVPLEAPQSDATFTWADTTVVVVEPAAAGIGGLGFSYATGACATLIRDLLAPVVVGSPALDPPGAWRGMVGAVRNVGRPGAASMAIAAVDIALWDLKARLLDLPLCRVIGSMRDEVAVYGSGGFTSMTDDELERQLGRWVHDRGSAG